MVDDFAIDQIYQRNVVIFLQGDDRNVIAVDVDVFRFWVAGGNGEPALLAILRGIACRASSYSGFKLRLAFTPNPAYVQGREGGSQRNPSCTP